MPTKQRRYGMSFSSIRYWQNRALDLWRYNGIIAGRWIFAMKHNDKLAGCSPRDIGHAIIQIAVVLGPEETKRLLQAGADPLAWKE